MSIALYSASIPVFTQMLQALREILHKAQAHAEARKIEPGVLLASRLYPDMFPLMRQVQVAADFARGIASRLSALEPSTAANAEQSFADLDATLGSTLRFLAELKPEQMMGAATREIVLRPGTPKEKRLLGSAYLLSYGLPQFFFHVTTSYAILRHCGVELAKRDFMGTY